MATLETGSITGEVYAIAHALADVALPVPPAAGVHMTWTAWTALADYIAGSLSAGWNRNKAPVRGGSGQLNQSMIYNKNALDSLSITFGVDAVIKSLAFAPWTAGVRVEPPSLPTIGALIDWTDYDTYTIVAGGLWQDYLGCDGAVVALDDSDIQISTMFEAADFNTARKQGRGNCYPYASGWNQVTFGIQSTGEDTAALSSFASTVSHVTKQGITPTYFSMVAELGGLGILYFPKVIINSPEMSSETNAPNSLKYTVDVLSYIEPGTPANNVIGGMEYQGCATGSIGNWGFSSGASVSSLVMQEDISLKVKRAIAWEISGQKAVYVANCVVGPPTIKGSPSKTVTLEYPIKVNCTSTYPAGYAETFYQAA